MPQPIPRDLWPRHAESLARFAKPGDLGLGTVCHRIIESASDIQAGWAVASFLEAEYGLKVSILDGIRWRLGVRSGDQFQDCGGCQLRQAESDAKYPLNLSL